MSQVQFFSDESTSLSVGQKAWAFFSYVTLWGAWAFAVGSIFCLDLFGSPAFNWHPTLMVTAFMLFMTHGVMIYRAPYLGGSIEGKRIGHGIVQYTAVFTSLIGLTIILVFKSLNNLPLAPSTNHAYVGIAALSCVVFQVLLGFLKYRLIPVRPPPLKLHGYLGFATWMLGLAAIGLGFQDWIDKASPVDPWVYTFTYANWGVISALAVVVLIGRVWFPWPKAEIATVGETEPLYPRRYDM